MIYRIELSAMCRVVLALRKGTWCIEAQYFYQTPRSVWKRVSPPIKLPDSSREDAMELALRYALKLNRAKETK